ncbi:hypothetical protein CSC12_5398 [Klebsiella michiganensis]|nr:hypothetical protein CSC12_5398 [Klebsiella michiganensis]
MASGYLPAAYLLLSISGSIRTMKTLINKFYFSAHYSIRR